MVRRERGFTVIELVCAMAVLTILASAALLGTRAHLVEIGRSLDELAASRAASGRLEALSAPGVALEPGEHAFPVDLPGAEGTEVVTRLRPGLDEVTVTVRAGPHGPVVSLTTLVASEEDER
jgi:prepilin-type N-terminal cleavage/methylation domain-containing protein